MDGSRFSLFFRSSFFWMASDNIVVGMLNMDHVSIAPRPPVIGKALYGLRFDTGFGGKGASPGCGSSKARC